MKNKILSLLLSFSMILMLCNVMVSAETEGQEVSFETKVMRGLFVIDSDYETNPNDKVTRGDFVRILMDMINAPQAESAENNPFSDLSSGASYANAVIYAASRGYVSGYSDGTFRPSKSITALEAATAVLNVAGYDMAAVSEGYPSLASSEDLFKGISSNINEPITKRDVAKLLYNALSVEVYSLSALDGSGNFSIERSGDLFMEVFMDMTRKRDIITSTYVTSLEGAATCAQGEIGLGGVSYTLSYEEAEQYLGYRVEAYIKTIDDEDTLVYAVPYRNETIEIKSEDITEDSTNTLVYYEVDGSSKLSKIKVKIDADKIVNGVADINSGLIELIAKSDTLNFIDNDGDGVTDVVVVYAYDEIYVRSVSVSNEKIYGKYTFTGAITELELEDADEVIITKNGVAAELKDIKENDILTVINTNNADRRIVRIEVCDKKVSGNVTRIDYNEGIFYIDGNEYKVSDLYTKALAANDILAKKIELSMSATFYLNSFGKISAVVIDYSGEYYGFLKKAYIDDTDIDMAVKFKILGTDGDWQIYEAEPKIKVQGKKIAAENVFDNLLFSGDGIHITPQLVEFKLNNDSKITSITAAKYSENYADDDFRYKTISNQTFFYNNSSFNSKEYITGNTSVFSIPVLYDGGSKRYTDAELSAIDDDYFLVRSGPNFSDGKNYTLNVYNSDMFGVTELVTYEAVLNDIGVGTINKFLFYDITEELNADDEVETLIKGMHMNNINATAALRDDCLVYDKAGNKKDISYLERGDLLNLHRDLLGEIYRIDVIYEADKSERSKYTGSMHGNNVIVYGYIDEIDNERGFINLHDGLAETKTIKLQKNNLLVLVYDSETRKDNIKVGDINSLQRGDYVMLSGSYSQFSYVVKYE